jgi:glucose 1-dehydrogenase
MGLLDNKVAVITGSSRGLGLSIAQAYCREGASVLITSRTPKAVDTAAKTLQDQGHKAVGQAGDVASLADVQALAERAICEFGALDIWVNNAGLGAPYGATLGVAPERFELVVRTNILGTYYGSRVAMGQFVLRGSGKLINLIGRGADRPVPLQNAYASSKAWVRSFTKALAAEYKDSGVGVFAFNPGLVLTDMLSNIEAQQGYTEKVSPIETVTRMWANPPAVAAEKAVWLASSATDGKTGLDVSLLTPKLIISGALGEGWRRIRRRTSLASDLTIREVPLAEPDFIDPDEC